MTHYLSLSGGPLGGRIIEHEGDITPDANGVEGSEIELTYGVPQLDEQGNAVRVDVTAVYRVATLNTSVINGEANSSGIAVYVR